MATKKTSRFDNNSQALRESEAIDRLVKVTQELKAKAVTGKTSDYFVAVHGKDDTYYAKISRSEASRLMMTGAFKANLSGDIAYIEAKD